MYGRPTRYHGVTFRSELEARWASFLDGAHIPWRYEAQSFEFDDESGYIPDFFLPGIRAWLEVKPASIDRTSSGKAIKLAVETATNVFIALSIPAFAFDTPKGQLVRFSPLGQMYSGYRFTNCEDSGAIGITVDGNLADLHCCPMHSRADLGHTTGRLFTATVIARLARFNE